MIKQTYFKSIKLIFFEISIQLYVHINSQHNLKINYFNDTITSLRAVGQFPQNILTQQKLLKKIHIMKATGKRNDKRFLTQVLFFFKKKIKFLHKLQLTRKIMHHSMRKNLILLSSCPSPALEKMMLHPLQATAEGKTQLNNYKCKQFQEE